LAAAAAVLCAREHAARLDDATHIVRRGLPFRAVTREERM